MGSDERAVSELLGYVIVFSLVLASVALVSTVGLNQLESARDAEQLNNAEQAFDLLATNMDDIARRGAPSRSTEMQLVGGQVTVTDPITVTFRGIDDDAPTANNFNESYDVRPIRYTGRADDRAVVYVGGAVFRTNGDGGTTIRRPSFVATPDRLYVPFVHTRAQSVQSRGGGTARLRANHGQTVLLASDSAGTYEHVYMNVTSPRASRWVETLSHYDAFTCSLVDSGATASCRADDPVQLQIALVQIDVELNA